MNRIEQIIGEIEEFIESCKSYPLSSSKIIVPKEELSELYPKKWTKLAEGILYKYTYC